MYLNILKKDLKRKKTMNVILLIFVLLSAMFMASSVNNIIAVTSGLDTFFEEAGMADHYVLALDSEDNNLSKALDKLGSTTEYKREDIFFSIGSNVEINGEPMKDLDRTAIVMSVDNRKLNYYSPDNKEITEVEKGKCYISGPFSNEAKLEVGDKFTLVIGEHRLEFEFAGRAKDALLGSDFMGNPRFILNDADYKYLLQDEKAQSFDGSIYYIKSTDTAAVESAVGEQGGIILSADNNTIRTTYIMSMIVAALLLIVSLFLIVVSFVVLKHTIGFTLAEDFREIGVMKAIGMKNSSIRVLYLIKYFAITLVGSVIGFVLSIPFSDFMLKSVSTSMYLGSENSILVGVLCSIAVVLITLLFCWTSTKKIKKLSPIDAVRNGQTGERFRKKSLMHLRKSRLGSNAFLATNDIISAPKKYSIITTVFAVLMLLVMILANTANTLNSEKLLFLLGCTESDAYLSQTDAAVEALNPDVNPKEVLDKVIVDIKNKLKDNDMPAQVHVESQYTTSVIANGSKSGVAFQHCPDTKASDYTYSEGVAPQNKDEVALSYLVAEKLNVKVGDEIIILADGEECKCTVTALFQTFQQMGTVCRLHEDFDVSKLDIAGVFFFQIDFDDNPNKAEIDNRIEKLKDIFDTNQIYNCADFVKDCTGAADTINAVKNLVLIIVLIVVILVAVLMERSFISSEKAEIALMKAIGFSNRSIIWHHTLRFAIVAFVSSILAAILCIPLTKLTMDPVMRIMGAVSGVSYEIAPLEIFGFYPLILVGVTIIAAFFTSIYTNTIKSSDAADIE